MQETAMRVAVRFGILLQLALTLYGSDTEAILSPLGFGIGQATVDLSSVEYTASEESGFLTIQLVANQTVTGTEEVTVVFTSNSSKLNLETDLNLGGNSILLTFENGSMESNFTIGIIDDNIYEDTEILFATIMNTSMGLVEGCNVSAMITIIDNDEVNVSSSVVSNSVAEGGTVDLLLIADAPGGGVEANVSVVITIVVVDGTAEGTDYWVTDQLVIFEPFPNNSTMYVSVLSVADDNIVEEDETLVVMVIATGDRVSFTLTEANITIVDNDYMEVEFSQGSYSVAEEAGVLVVEVVANATAEDNVTVTIYTQNVTAFALSDYIVEPVGFAVIPAGSMSVNYSITIVNDVLFEELFEYFMLNITTISNPYLSSDKISIGTNSFTNASIEDNEVINIFVAVESRVNEYSNVEVTVNATYPAGGLDAAAQLYLDISVTDNTTDSTDYGMLDPISITFFPQDSGMFSSMHTFQLNNDDVVEIDEVFLLTLSNSDSRFSLAIQTTEVTIIDDDYMEVDFSLSSYSIGEGSGVLVVEIAANATADGDVSVFITFQNFTASDLSDYMEPAPFAVIPAGSMSIDYNISIIDDDCFEEQFEYFMLSITSVTSPTFSSDKFSIGTNSPTTATIEDNEVIAIDVVVESRVNEYSNVAVTVTAVYPMGGLVLNVPLFLDVSVIDNTTDSNDYVMLDRITVVLPQGNISTTTIFPSVQLIYNDDVVEIDELFWIYLSNNDSRFTFISQPTEVTIIDDDFLELSFNVTDYTVVENDGVATVSISANTTAGYVFAVNLRNTAISATSGADFAAGNISVIFQPGSMSASANSTIIDDDVYEGFESFNSSIISVTSEISSDKFILGSTIETTITIQDDEMLEIVATITPTAIEGEGFLVMLALTVPSGGVPNMVVLQLDVLITDITTTPSDYFNLSTINLHLVPPVGNQILNGSISILEDDILEASESFTFDLSVSAETQALHNLKFTPPAAPNNVVTIEDNDVLTVDFEMAYYSVNESEVVLNVVVVANGTSSVDFQVDFAFADITTNGDINLTASFSRNFTAGVPNITIQVFIDDDIFEDAENASLSISSTGNPRVLIGSISEAIITIEDNEILYVTVPTIIQLILESAGFASATVDFTLPPGGTEVNITLPVSFSDGTATQPLDYYVLEPNILLYSTTSLLASLMYDVSIVDDSIFEVDENFFLAVYSTNPRIVSSGSQEFVIGNNDVISVELPASSYNVSEADGSMTLMLTLNGTSPFDIRINFTITDVTTNAYDYNLTGPFYVTIPAGYSNASITINIDDKVFENEESFIVQLSSTSSADVLLGPVYSTSVYIQDDEEIALYFAYSNFTVAESYGQLLVTIAATLPTGGSEVTATVAVTFTDGTALVDKDYVYNANSTSFTLYPTSNITLTHQLWVTIIDDQMAEAYLENFYISLGVNFSRVVTKLNKTVVYIEDDDAIMVEFQSNSTTVSEGGTANMTVVANRTSAVTYTVSLALLDVTTNSRDYVTPNLTYTLYPGETTFVISIETFDDSIFEGTEYLTVVIHNTSEPLILIGSNNYSIVAISDNEAVEVSFSEASFRASEASLNSEAVVEMTAVLPAGGTSIPIEVMINAQPATAREMFDFNQPGVLSFTDPTGLLAFIPLVDDTVAEPDEYLTLNLSVVTEGVFFRLGSATLSISDNDECPCQNGGICEFFQDQLNCTCAPGFLGGECQTSIAQPLEQLTTPIAVGVSSGVVALGIVIFMIIILVLIVLRKRK